MKVAQLSQAELARHRKRRVGDVYFAIVTQAIAAILSILIIGQQGLTGGVNGITDLRTMLGWDIRTTSAH